MRQSGAAGFGENLAWAGGQHLNPARVVQMRVDEGRAYSLAGNSSTAGAVCGHFTQVVWRKTKLIGCGRANCGDAELWVCNYSPPGNDIGEKPY